jgi:Tfp pilus assembly protein PilV
MTRACLEGRRRSPRRRRRYGGQRGISLIEVMVGLALTATCVIAMNALVVAMIRGNLSAQLIDQATLLAESKLAEVANTPYQQLTIGTTTDQWWSATAGNSIRFDRATSIAAGVLADTRTVSVTVAWNDRGSRSETFTTEVVR